MVKKEDKDIEQYLPDDSKKARLPSGLKLLIYAFGIIILISVILGAFFTVGAGEEAVLLTWGRPNPVPFESGLHFKIPFVQNAVIMNIKTLKYETKASAASQDLQIVSTDVAVNYHINAGQVVQLYKNIGIGYQDVIIQPAVQEVVKAVTSQFTAEQLITNRSFVKDQIDQKLKDRLNTYDIIVDTISITNFDFSQSFNEAIENKVTTEQNALAAKNKLEQVQYEAQQTIAKAQGDAQAISIQAQAIRQQGGQQYVQLQAIQRWNGILPEFVGGGAIPFVNIPNGNSQGILNQS